nr:xylulose kinase-1 [Tanacetum cinerariifolium]
GNIPKRLGKDSKGNTIVHPPVSYEEHVAVQKENKVRTLLLQALPEDHMPDFHHYDDAMDIWMAVKARFGGNEESKKMRKTMLKQQFTEFSVTEEEWADNRPSMLEKNMYDSWKSRIKLYMLNRPNGRMILESNIILQGLPPEVYAL